MSVKRFVAADMRRALELIREEMGPDAVILSNRRIKEGVEILCTLEQPPQVPEQKRPLATDSRDLGAPMNSDSAWAEQAQIDKAVAENQARAQLCELHAPMQTKAQIASQRNFSGKSPEQLAQEIERAREKMLAAKRGEQASESTPDFASALAAQSKVEANSASQHSDSAPEQHSTPAAVAQFDQHLVERERREQDVELGKLQSELADMRQLLEQQLGRMSWGQLAAESPVKANLYRRFHRLGLSAAASEGLIAGLAHPQTLAEAWPEALATLSHQIPIAADDVVDAGGVFAFVGPTGVGKTTTIGKLAARYVLKHGADKVALVTTDTYRIAGSDQLKTLGRILKVPVRVVDDANSLPAVLAALSDYPLILIDTAGFRCGDSLLKEQLAILSQQARIKKYLVLSCNSQLQTLKANVHAYRDAALAGCVLTKLDECASLGEALGVVLEHQLPVAYTTDGQEIPRDISVARGHQLVTSAVSLMKNNSVDDLALVDDFSQLARVHSGGIQTGC